MNTNATESRLLKATTSVMTGEPSPRAIDDQLQSMHQWIETLFKATAGLAERIAPVMTQHLTAEAHEAGPIREPAILSPMAQELMQMNEQMERLAERIRELANAVQL